MLKVNDENLKKVYNRLVKMFDGDRSQMRKAIDEIITDDKSWGSNRYKNLESLAKAINKRSNVCTRRLATQACIQIKERLDNETTEKPPPVKTQPTTEKPYNQLTLDFSATTENSPAASSPPPPPAPTRRQTKQQQEEQSVCKKFNGKPGKKGWLTPQYKWFDSCGRSHTTTDPSKVPAVKIYGPYWTYRWSRPGKKNDDNLYLGATSSKKFQHFSVVWERSGSTAEVLEWFRYEHRGGKQ